MRRVASAGGIAVYFLGLAVAGHAQTASGQDAVLLDQVTIDAVDDGGKSGVRPKTATIGPLGRRQIMDTPYSVSVIDKTLIENQQATTLPDVLKYMPSTQMEARGGGDVGRPQSRGMQGTPVFNNRLDGMNIVATTAQPIEMYERVEVVNGLAGAYFGPASPGGLFNFTRKRPTAEPYNRIATGFSGKDTWLAHGDFGGHFADGMLGYRINLLNEQGEGYVKDSHLDRSLISGAFDINLTDRTTIELNASRYRFDKFGFPGSFSYDNSIILPDAPDPTRVGYGQKFAGYGLKDTVVGGLVKHRFNDDWTLTAGLQHQRVSRWFPSVSNVLLDDAGNYSNSIDAGVAGQFRVTSNIAVLNGAFSTGAVRHDVHLGTTGVNWENYSARSGNPSVTEYLGDASIDHPVQWDAPTGFVRNGPRYRSFSNRSQSLVFGDSITFNEQWSAIVSGSYTWFDVKNYDETGATTQKYSKRGFSPSVALTYKPAENITTYVAYADTLQSGGSAPTTAANAGQILAPERSKQVEIGAKADLGGLDASVAVFRIERPFAFTGDDNVYRVQGDQVNKGVELGLRGELLENLNIYGGLTLLDPKLKNTGNSQTSNTDVVGVPKVQANLFMEYFFKSVPELSASANLHYTGKRAGNNINSFKVDSYATLDLGLRYERQVNSNSTAVLNLAVTNVFDEHYWASIFPGSIDGATRGANSAFLGAPREVRLSASLKF